MFERFLVETWEANQRRHWLEVGKHTLRIIGPKDGDEWEAFIDFVKPRIDQYIDPKQRPELIAQFLRETGKLVGEPNERQSLRLRS